MMYPVTVLQPFPLISHDVEWPEARIYDVTSIVCDSQSINQLLPVRTIL